MTEDASLDQFASSGETDESETDDSAEPEPVEPESTASETPEDSDEQFEEVEKQAEESADSATDLSTVEPAVSTYEWSPEGGECADCGASAKRRWRSEGQKDGGLVCADCKEW